MTEDIHVLYVDDEPDLLTLGKMFLEQKEGLTVTILESAISALQLIQSQPFDAIISDYQMPGMDGIEFLKNVRSSRNNIPFIIFTGRGREEIVIQALNEGADFYIQKGGDPKSQYLELAHKIRLAVNQRRLEENIRDHERREADILNFLPDATFAINTDGNVIAWNQAMEQMTGVQASDILGKGNYEYAIPFYHERRPLLVNHVLHNDPDIVAMYSFIKDDGNHLSSEITISHFHGGSGAILWFIASPLYDNHGNIIGAIESIRDITESKRAEIELHKNHEQLQVAYEEIYAADQELRSGLEKLTEQTHKLEEREQQLQAMASNIPGVIFRFIVNPDGTTGFDYISSRCYEILGIENNPRIFSEQLTNNIVAEDKEQFLFSLQHAIDKKTAWIFECRYMKPSCEIVWLKAVSSPIFENDTYIYDGIIFDETDQKQKEDFIRFLAQISDESPASITVHDFEGKMLYANEKSFHLHGYTRDEFFALNLHELDVPESEELILERMQKLFSQKIHEFEVEHFRKDGSRIPLNINAKVIEWNGKPVILSIATDLTILKQNEEILRKKNEELDYQNQLINTILDTVPIGIFMVEAPTGKPLISNPAATKLLGRGILPDAIEESLSEVYEAFKMGSLLKYPTSEMPIVRGMYGESSHIDDMEVLHPDGKRVLLEVFGNPVIDKQGKVVASLVSFLDITERNKMEVLLKENEENARVLINAPKESIFMMIPDGTILYANETMASRLGYKVKDIIGKSAFEITPPEVTEGRKKYVGEVIKSKKEVHFQDERFGRIIENNLYPVLDVSGNVSRIAIYGNDITEREEGKRKIAESEEKYRTLVEQAHDGIVIVQGNHLVFANEAITKISGYSIEELEGSEIKKYIPTEEILKIQDYLNDLYLGKENLKQCELSLIRKDTSVFPIEVNGARIQYSGKSAGLLLIHDISDRKEAEGLLKKTLNLLKETQKLTKLGGWEYEVATGKMSWTDEVYHIHGVGLEYDPNNIEQDITFYTPEDAVIIEKAFYQAANEGIPYDLELKFIRADKRQIWVRTIGHPIVKNGVVIRITGNIIDITEKKYLELSLREALQKLKVLTGITRHDVVNDLNVIILSLDLFKEETEEDQKKKLISNVLEAAKVLEKTITFTREYEQFGLISSRWGKISLIISSSQSSVVLTGVTVHISISSDLEIYTDPIIMKVFSTLFENSMRHGGNALSEIQIFTLEQGLNLAIIYEDNGIGIPEQEKELIFNHGYGKNTGIGLFLTREILSISGFTIRECGLEGKGVRFEIVIPSGLFRYHHE